jgi:hypothetical protein
VKEKAKEKKKKGEAGASGKVEVKGGVQVGN